MYPQILNSVGLALSAIGAVLMFLATWGNEPEPGFSIVELIEATARQNDLAMLTTTFPSPEAARDYCNKQIDEALYSARRRNQHRRKLNRVGLGLLIAGFVLQFIALWC
jgi:hypothetical protein